MRLTMKRTIILLFPILGLADITSVRVTGTTATQVTLAYTAPDTGACTVAVSTSPTYTPLAHDVDTALFTGANSDSRPGNITSGRSRVFVVGKRSVEGNLTGNNSSRALQAATLYYFRISCPSDGSNAAGTFMTQTIPGGVGYGDPIPIDPANNGNYLYPTFSATDRTSSAIDPHTGALIRNLTLPNDVTGGGLTAMSDSGGGVMCHPTPVKASDENKYGYHCQITVGGVPTLYWIAPDGETRFLGVMMVNYVDPNGWNPQQCLSLLSAPFDAVDPNTFYCPVSGNTPPNTTPIIVKVVYTGHSVPGQDVDLTNQDSYQIRGMPHSTFTQILPWGRDLNTLLKEFDPKFVTYQGIFQYLRPGDWANGKYFFYYLGATQDTFGWIAELDPNRTPAQQIAQFGNANGCVDNPAVTGSTYTGQSGCMIASTGSFTGGQGSLFRWSVLHVITVTPASSLLPVGLNAIRMKEDPSAYQVTLTSALSSAPGSCAMAQPSGNTLANWPTTSWAYGCSTITVSGDPVLSSTQPGYPTSMPAAPGDLLSQNSYPFTHYELMRLLDKGTDGKTWYVQRRYYYDTLWPYSSIPIGGTLDMLSPGIGTDVNDTGIWAWWDPVNGALNTDGTNTYKDVLPSNHATYLNHPIYGRWTFDAGVGAQAGTEPGRLTNPPAVLPMDYPSFNGVAGSPNVEAHPSLSVSNAPDADTYNQVIDNHPYYGDDATVTATETTLVSGQLYRIRGTSVAANYKLTPYFANSGSRAMKEVSGPAARLATDSSTQYQWCVTLVAGECYTGSQAGDIYFNAPGITNAYCTYNWTTLLDTLTIPNDICVSASNAVTQAVVMQEISGDPNGLQLRVISNALSKYEQESTFWNARTIPDGSWAFTGFSGAAGNIMLAKIPPRAKESVTRTIYVPISVSLPAVSGVDNAIIQFGYGENGDPGSYYCTARQEACVAQGQTINASQPFYFGTTESASITGMPCRSGCTVTVPGIPGRVLYYRVSSRDSSGRVVGQQLGAQPVP